MLPVELSKVQETTTRQQKKQKQKAEEGKLHVKRQEMDKAKVREQFIHSRPSPCLPHPSLSRVMNVIINLRSTDCRRGKAVLVSPRPD